ncbi:MAG: sterol desaturase family protein [Betaproteobacteria bacterium]|nr:sterol desaturase family protein [Betaproteobacteria bacterium]
MYDDDLTGTAEAIAARRTRLAPGIPRHYHPLPYFGAANLLALSAITFSLLNLHAVTFWEWLLVPIAFLVANWVEYRVHRGPMHHLTPPWKILFQRHTRQHHVFFDNTHMSADRPQDYYFVFFPCWAIGLVIITAALFAFPLRMLLSRNAGLLFFAVAIAYYLAYEWLHLSYHLPADSFIGRTWLVKKLRRLHTAHHDVTLMTRCNFNITFPICDRLFGTLDTRMKSPAKPR